MQEYYTKARHLIINQYTYTEVLILYQPPQTHLLRRIVKSKAVAALHQSIKLKTVQELEIVFSC